MMTGLIQFIGIEGSTWHKWVTPELTEMKIAEFANIIDLDEVVHNEPLHLDLHCLPSSL